MRATYGVPFRDDEDFDEASFREWAIECGCTDLRFINEGADMVATGTQEAIDIFSDDLSFGPTKIEC